jgi:hypothetical protein
MNTSGNTSCADILRLLIGSCISGVEECGGVRWSALIGKSIVLMLTVFGEDCKCVLVDISARLLSGFT